MQSTVTGALSGTTFPSSVCCIGGPTPQPTGGGQFALLLKAAKRESSTRLIPITKVLHEPASTLGNETDAELLISTHSVAASQALASVICLPFKRQVAVAVTPSEPP